MDTLELTSFPHDAADPWTKMVHLQNTSFNLTAMMSSIRLPITTGGAPFWPSIVVTGKYVLAVERLEAWAIGVIVWMGVGRLGFNIFLATRSSAFSFLILLLYYGVGPEWDNSGVGLDDKEKSQISYQR